MLLTPVDRAGALVGYFPARAAFPVSKAARRPRLRFRGLLKLHSCYGLQGCSPTLQWTLSQGCDPASYPTGPPVSYHVYRQLHGWVLPPMANCADKAHLEIPAARVRTRWPAGSNEEGRTHQGCSLSWPSLRGEKSRSHRRRTKHGAGTKNPATASRTKSPETNYIAPVRGLLSGYPVRTNDPPPSVLNFFQQGYTLARFPAFTWTYCRLCGDVAVLPSRQDSSRITAHSERIVHDWPSGAAVVGFTL